MWPPVLFLDTRLVSPLLHWPDRVTDFDLATNARASSCASNHDNCVQGCEYMKQADVDSFSVWTVVSARDSLDSALFLFEVFSFSLLQAVALPFYIKIRFL